MFSSKNIISLTNENAIIIMFMNMIKDYSGKLVKGLSFFPGIFIKP